MAFTPAKIGITGLLLAACAASADGGGEPATQVALYDKGLASFYVAGHIGGHGDTEFMVDTGSAYVAIGESIVRKLADKGLAKYLRTKSAVLANGDTISIRVYRISSLRVGDRCELRNVEVAGVPGLQRQILGLSALKMAAPFTISVEPPSLSLSRCSIVSVDLKPPTQPERGPLLAKSSLAEAELIGR